MRLSLAISAALLFGSYVAAIPVWPNDNGEASGSGSGNNFGAPGPHVPPPNHPPPHYPPRFHPTFGYLPDPDHQFQPQQPDATQYLPPNHPPPGHPPLSHHNLPGPASQFQPQEPPPLDTVLGNSRGGLFGVPYRCTGCRHQSPGPDPGPGPGVDRPVPSTRVNRNNRLGPGSAAGAVRRPRTRPGNPNPYVRTRHPNSSDPGPSSSGGGPPPPNNGRLSCPGCRNTFKTPKTLRAHQQRTNHS